MQSDDINEQSLILQLPDEILVSIFMYLDWSSLIKLGYVSHQFLRASEDNRLWLPYLEYGNYDLNIKCAKQHIAERLILAKPAYLELQELTTKYAPHFKLLKALFPTLAIFSQHVYPVILPFSILENTTHIKIYTDIIKLPIESCPTNQVRIYLYPNIDNIHPNPYDMIDYLLCIPILISSKSINFILHNAIFNPSKESAHEQLSFHTLTNSPQSLNALFSGINLEEITTLKYIKQYNDLNLEELLLKGKTIVHQQVIELDKTRNLNDMVTSNKLSR